MSPLVCKLYALVTFTMLLVLTTAAPQNLPLRPYPHNYQQDPSKSYAYEYHVANPPTYTYYGKKESSDAAGRVTGTSYVYLPDGRLMTVEYYADAKVGFLPKVTISKAPVQGQGK